MGPAADLQPVWGFEISNHNIKDDTSFQMSVPGSDGCIFSGTDVCIINFMMRIIYTRRCRFQCTKLAPNLATLAFVQLYVYCKEFTDLRRVLLDVGHVFFHASFFVRRRTRSSIAHRPPKDKAQSLTSAEIHVSTFIWPVAI